MSRARRDLQYPGSHLKYWLTRRRMSVARLAALADTSTQTIYRIINSNENWSRDLMARLAHGLGLDLQTLLGPLEPAETALQAGLEPVLAARLLNASAGIPRPLLEINIHYLETLQAYLSSQADGEQRDTQEAV